MRGERQLPPAESAQPRKCLFCLSCSTLPLFSASPTGRGDTLADPAGSPTPWLHDLEGLRKFVANGRRRHSRLQPPSVRVVRVRVLQQVAAVPAVVGAPVAVASR